MTTTTSVKWAASSMTGAPVLNGTAGSLISVLDASLVTGFGAKAVDSATVTDGICRINIAGGSAAQEHCVIQLDGITGGGATVNGEQRVTAATTSYVEFPCDLPDGPLTGAITFKIAPMGWEKVFAATNKAVYRSADIAGTRMFLRVDDTANQSARVTGWEHASGVDAGVAAFPTAAQVSGGGYWPKSSAASAAARAWTLIGDSKGFWLHVHTAADTGVAGVVFGFGDFKSRKSGDAYACALHCAASEISTAGDSNVQAVEHASPSGGTHAFVPRSYTGIGSSVNAAHGCESFINGTGVAGVVSAQLVPSYPNGPDSGLVLTRKVLAEPGVALRGHARGLHMPVQNCHAAFAWQDMIDGQGALTGRKLMAVKCGGPAATTSKGVLFFDITGPWS